MVNRYIRFVIVTSTWVEYLGVEWSFCWTLNSDVKFLLVCHAQEEAKPKGKISQVDRVDLLYVLAWSQFSPAESLGSPSELLPPSHREEPDKERARTRRRIYVSQKAWECRGFPTEELDKTKRSWRWKSVDLCVGSNHNLTWTCSQGWMDRWIKACHPWRLSRAV